MGIKDLDVICFCFSLADKQTLNEVAEKWIDEVDEVNRYAPKMLVGCKSDMQRAVEDHEIDSFCKKYGFFAY